MITDVCYARHAAWLALSAALRGDLVIAQTRARSRLPVELLVACTCGAEIGEGCRERDTDEDVGGPLARRTVLPPAPEVTCG